VVLLICCVCSGVRVKPACCATTVPPATPSSTAAIASLPVMAMVFPLSVEARQCDGCRIRMRHFVTLAKV